MMTNGQYQLIQLREDTLAHFREFERFRHEKFKPVIKALAAVVDAANAQLQAEQFVTCGTISTEGPK